MGKRWTKEDLDYLELKWGVVSIPTLSKKLNRTEVAVVLKAKRLKLGRFTDNGNYITFSQLASVFGGSGTRGGKLKSWIEQRGLPYRYKKVGKSKVRVVDLNEFWKWAEDNKSFIDFSKLEPNILYGEPEWVSAKRDLDIQMNRLYKKTAWTKQEEELLKTLLKQHIYTYQELSEKLCRTTGAINKKIHQLGLRERPVKAEHSTVWNDDMRNEVKELIYKGMSYEMISKSIGRNTGSIRSMLYREYKTERLENIYKIIKEDKLK